MSAETINAFVPTETAAPSDRLGLTICLAIIIHTMIVMGVSFSPEPAPESRFESLEVVLVTQRSEVPPEATDMLAQVSDAGSGTSPTVERPSTPVKAPLPAPRAEVAATTAPPVEAQAEPDPSEDATAPATADAQQAEAEVVAKAEERLVEEVSEADLAKPEPEAKPEPKTLVAQASPVKEQPTPKVVTPPLPTAAQLITRSFAMASLNAELQQKLDVRAHRPRRKFISASTKEYRFASYMVAWTAKVLRVGNLNYPDEARRKNLSGSLLLDVAINSDGSVNEITVRRSSGYKILDDAAVRIVELSAPYAPFPDDFAKELDILHVTRTWNFVNNTGFMSQ